MNLDNDCCLETTSDAFRIGSRTERERIIKLLENLIEERSGVNLQGAIALIKEKSK